MGSYIIIYGNGRYLGILTFHRRLDKRLVDDDVKLSEEDQRTFDLLRKQLTAGLKKFYLVNDALKM